ncbi:MAG: NAD(P)/FAD-dependent oxidoreductase [Chloroflexota bacterium]|nr:MAG: NAD(P)/FAD-dependent oxidoreductase [Chloroflexota bacterium]
MPDTTYDAVIVGGGTKGLFLAMYLARYGGMSVGVFERRHESGGGLAGEESAAPGFTGNIHATMLYLHQHWMQLWRDFPEFEEYGGQVDQHVCINGAIFADTEKSLVTYSTKHDPTQERSAQNIAKISERDAELWLKVWEVREPLIKAICMSYSTIPTVGGAMARYQRPLEALAEKGMKLDPVFGSYSCLRAAKELWESKEMQKLMVRLAMSRGADILAAGGGMASGLLEPATQPLMCFQVGGTHQAAHAAHRVLIRDGVKAWTNCEVDKVIIENGTAKGIRLKDGTEIGARRVVISTLSPQQLCFDLIGKEHLNSQIIRRIELLESDSLCIAWYQWALHEAPKYKLAQVNPDLNDANWLDLHLDNDPDSLAREAYWRKLGKMPPFEDLNPVVWCHSVADPRYAPVGKHLASHEQFMPPATAFSEREWLALKKQHAEDIMKLWQMFAPNMTWDNVIGVDSNTPYDVLRLKNMAPNGNWNVLDNVPHQSGAYRPIPELAHYRTPIKNLYGTGSGWSGGGGTVGAGYMCYKAIAEDMDLGKPWLEPGKEEPDSLYEQVIRVEKKLQQSVVEKKLQQSVKV